MPFGCFIFFTSSKSLPLYCRDFGHFLFPQHFYSLLYDLFHSQFLNIFFSIFTMVHLSNFLCFNNFVLFIVVLVAPFFFHDFFRVLFLYIYTTFCFRKNVVIFHCHFSFVSQQHLHVLLPYCLNHFSILYYCINAHFYSSNSSSSVHCRTFVPLFVSATMLLRTIYVTFCSPTMLPRFINVLFGPIFFVSLTILNFFILYCSFLYFSSNSFISYCSILIPSYVYSTGLTHLYYSMFDFFNNSFTFYCCIFVTFFLQQCFQISLPYCAIFVYQQFFHVSMPY